MILMGRSEVGKTTLIEALRGESIVYRKTQYIDYSDTFVDTPGEYTEGNDLGGALAVYSYEADVVGLVVAADDEFCIFLMRSWKRSSLPLSITRKMQESCLSAHRKNISRWISDRPEGC